LQEGRADLIVGDARRMGIAKVLERSSSEDLAALASAARYQHQEALARRALLAQRRRFPGSVRARDAAFLLGRLEDESKGGADEALRWYDRYLVEAPEGAYASEALGRKMMTLRRNGQLAEASEIAADYLRRFPTGTYAHAARPLLRSR
jgi:TolA-binding protein